MYANAFSNCVQIARLVRTSAIFVGQETDEDRGCSRMFLRMFTSVVFKKELVTNSFLNTTDIEPRSVAFKKESMNQFLLERNRGLRSIFVESPTKIESSKSRTMQLTRPKQLMAIYIYIYINAKLIAKLTMFKKKFVTKIFLNIVN